MSLELLPAIDLRGGRCVRLLHGDPDAETVYGDDPAAQAERFAAAGARWLHVVDLDGAFSGERPNRDAIARVIATSGLAVEVGGGLRSRDAVEDVLGLGAARVILGTAALADPALLADLCRSFPGRVWVGIDARAGKVAVQGWQVATDRDATTFAVQVAEAGAGGIVYTDIHRDGARTGPNVEETARVARAVDIPVIASGGVGTLAHLEELKPLEADGVVGVISGRALYEGSLDLAAALRVLDGPAGGPA